MNMNATTKTSDKYYEAVGRRKTSIARVRLFVAKDTSFVINDMTLDAYFPTREMQATAGEAMKIAGAAEKFLVSAKIVGGGIVSQSEALRHGIARALEVYDGELRTKLKKAGFLSRDARAKERRKFGLKKARKSPQWAKR